MAKKKSRIDKDKEAFWLKHLHDWKSSSDTITTYCTRHGINANNFNWWKRVLKNRGKWPPKDQKTKTTNRALDAAFQEIKITPVKIHQESVELKIGIRYRIKVDADFHADTLSRLLDVLEQRPC